LQEICFNRLESEHKKFHFAIGENSTFQFMSIDQNISSNREDIGQNLVVVFLESCWNSNFEKCCSRYSEITKHFVDVGKLSEKFTTKDKNSKLTDTCRPIKPEQI
jgi:hypothetical protein